MHNILKQYIAYILKQDDENILKQDITNILKQDISNILKQDDVNILKQDIVVHSHLLSRYFLNTRSVNLWHGAKMQCITSNKSNQ